MEGSLVLLGGDPGIGKSTLLLQAVGAMASEGKKALYVSGEESSRQVAMRAERIGTENEDIYVLCETDIDQVTASIKETGPLVVVIDSIQTMYRSDMSSAPGSVSQVRECAALLHAPCQSRGLSHFSCEPCYKIGCDSGTHGA